MNKKLDIGIIGGGAAGFFAALSAKAHWPEAKVSVFEKSDKLLAKVKVSGGGRCNVTHHCFQISQMAKNYPRGSKQLKKAFGQFQAKDTVEWFQSRGVKLKTEEDNRMFPTTNNSQTIIDCLTSEAERLGVFINKKSPVQEIKPLKNGIELGFSGENKIQLDRVIVATGGSPKIGGFDWLANLGHTIVPPVPSLFTFNFPGNSVSQVNGPCGTQCFGTHTRHQTRKQRTVIDYTLGNEWSRRIETICIRCSHSKRIQL